MEIHVDCNGISSESLDGVKENPNKGNHDHHGTGKQTPTFSSQKKEKRKY